MQQWKISTLGLPLVQVNLATMTVTCSIHGLRQMPRPLPVQGPFTPAVVAGATGELVVPGDNALLQFYDLVHDRHIAKLQVRVCACVRVRVRVCR